MLLFVLSFEVNVMSFIMAGNENPGIDGRAAYAMTYQPTGDT